MDTGSYFTCLAVEQVVQRGTEILRAFCRDPAEQLRSMEVLMMRNFKEQCEGSNRGSMSSLAGRGPWCDE